MNQSTLQKMLLSICACGCLHNNYMVITSPKNFVFGEVLFSSACMCLSVCVCVCDSLYRLTQKVLDRFWWNSAGWFIMIKDKFFLKMSLIGSLERKLPKIRYFTFSSYVPLIIFFWGYFPFFIIGEVKYNKLLKKHLWL